jgi:acetyl-CoA decarbonylase/synthase complex subunit gamma
MISADLTFADRAGAWLVRWGIGRMSYIVPAGLYAIGCPTAKDPVVVTANYKMSYDFVRNALSGHKLWILVLETYGVNVWCAAGKGTFGTHELVRMIEDSGLSRVVSHRRLLVPILGAPGIAAHEVSERTGFEVRYATIRAADLPEYLESGMVATPRMRQLTFTLGERLVLIPVEIMLTLKQLALIGFLLYFIPTLLGHPSSGIRIAIGFIAAAVTGIVVTPLLLPWLPGRYFSLKGAVSGVVLVLALTCISAGSDQNELFILSSLFILPAVSAFYALNFTGCTPFTSRSGVKKEMRIAFPLMASSILVGIVMAVAGYFF